MSDALLNLGWTYAYLRISVVFEMVDPFFAYFRGFKFITDIFLESAQTFEMKLRPMATNPDTSRRRSDQWTLSTILTSDFLLRTPNLSTTLSRSLATSPTHGPLKRSIEKIGEST